MCSFFYFFFKLCLNSNIEELLNKYKLLSIFRSAFPYFQRRALSNPTWTHDFFLLALTDATKSPNFHEANSLIAAGLGKKRIVFPDKNGDFNHIKQLLEQEFTELKSQNGADRGGTSRPLFPVPLPVLAKTLGPKIISRTKCHTLLKSTACFLNALPRGLLFLYTIP